MKKQLTFILLAVIALCVMCTAVSAYGDYPLLIDESNLLTSDEQSALNQSLEKYSDQYDMDIVIVTVDSLNGNTATESADYVFDNYGYGRGDNLTGVLLLVSMGDRELAISTSGYCINYYDDYCIDGMISSVGSYLTSEEYYSAFINFIALCAGYADQYIEYAESGEYGYDYYDFSTGGGYGDEVAISRSANYGSYVMISIFGGLIIALISTSKMKKEMNNVKMNAGATAYVRKDSLNLTGEKDMFLYKNVSRTRRDTETRSGGGHHGGSVHVSSGGHSHGGGSGHF